MRVFGTHPIRIVSHGTGGYARGCRCDTCRTAYRRYHSDYRKRPNRSRVAEGLLTRYGMTLSDFEARLTAQGGACKICRTPLAPYGRRGGRTHVDHDPRSGRKPVRGRAVVRGILCHLCNQGLGKFRDNPEWLERAAQYVRTGGAV